MSNFNKRMNEVFHKEDNFYLSYLETPNELTQLVDQLICNIKEDGHEGIGRSETAICITKPDWKCLILYGDHREGYKPIANDLDKCIKYWQDHSSEVSHTSDYLNVEAPSLVPEETKEIALSH